MCLMPAVVLSLFTILAHAATDGPLSLSDQDRAGKCHDQGQECVIITSCGDLLGLLPLVSSWVGSAANSNWLLQVKTWNQKSQEQLVLSHCGFVKSLPMVCCAVVKKKVADSETDNYNDVLEDINKKVSRSKTDTHNEEDVNKKISDRKIDTNMVDDVNITDKKTDPETTIETSTMALTGITNDVSVNRK